MTIIHTREVRHGDRQDYRHEGGREGGYGFPGAARTAVRAAVVQGRRPRPATARCRPTSPRSAGAPMRYRGTGVLVSRASHRARPVTPATTVVLALIAGAVTLWLGLVAQFGGVAGSQVETPGRLAVVQVQAGESLQQLAQRVAPATPVGDVVDRIRELNELESVALTTGQTLIAPVS